MITSSLQPLLNEVEVSLFGSGFGEAIAVHLPGGHWFLVDSCIAHSDHSDKPVSGEYLELIGVQRTQVKAIIASHWHADHTKGLSRLASTYSDATIYYPHFFRTKEGLEFLASYSGSAISPEASTSELYQLFKNAPKRTVPCGMKTEILQSYLHNTKLIHVTAMSPMPAAFEKATAWLHGELNARSGYVRRVAIPSPNFSSIAIYVDVCGEGLLLGSDLEDHDQYGWSAIAQERRWLKNPKASLYKVAHHGSKTGHSELKWANLLIPSPATALTPFSYGVTNLPTSLDIKRIKALSKSVHTSSASSQSATLPSTHLKLLKQVATSISVRQRKMGHVRFRKAIGDSQWRIETFGAARSL